MIVDTSALLAVLFEENDAQSVLARALAHTTRRISAANLLEAGIKADSHPNPSKGAALDVLLEELEIQVETVTLDQAAVARAAYRRFGRGRHPAKLNFGDCFAYALAKTTGEPLLYTGSDFGLTDVTSC